MTPRCLVYTVIAVISGLVSGCINDDPEPKSIVKVGDMLPEFSVVMNDGSTVTTASLRGAPSMIVFFTTSCADCRRELPRINAYAASHPEVRVVCIARNLTEAEIEAFWQAENLTLPYSPQHDAAVYNLFATSGVPRIYCADPELRVSAIYVEVFPLLP